jgi:hypothetical protein
VASTSATRGKVKVYVDGDYKATVDLGKMGTAHQMVVWQASWSSVGSHKVRLVVQGTKGRPRVDLDAFVVVR